MIFYRILRALGRLALRWFYRDIEVVGADRLPERGPALLASNHPNALVDALVIGCTLKRPVTLTAKATLLNNPVTRILLRLAGVVPLRRASDMRTTGGSLDPARNDDAFAAVLDVLQHGGVVLLFPEGKSHSEPELAPLKTGLARIAVMARTERHLTAVPIIPVGLTFERKWDPRTRVLMHLGVPIMYEDGGSTGSDTVTALTQRVDRGLREVTLNFRTQDEAERVLSISTILADVFDDFRPLEAPDPPLLASVQVAQRINSVAPKLDCLDSGTSSRVDGFLERLGAFEGLACANGVAVGDVQMTRATGPGLWFAVREIGLAVLAGPVALWGRLNHWLPLRIARLVARKMSRLPDEPAMNTIVAGVALVLVFYIAQIALVARWTDWRIATVYAVTLPLSATWDFRYADRMRRAIARVRVYLRFRRDPALHNRLLEELGWLRREAVALDSLMQPVVVEYPST
jgi:1-acyl-sn-glycerol-3-phosphate acyltransferase